MDSLRIVPELHTPSALVGTVVGVGGFASFSGVDLLLGFALY